MTQRKRAKDLAAKIANTLSAAKRQALRREIAQWIQLDNQMRVRIGNPSIAVRAPQMARQVLAIFPGMK